MKLARMLMAVLLALVCGIAQASDVAYTARPIALKAKPYTDAATVANLPQNTQVKIIARQGSWDKIRVGRRVGWVKMLSLRMTVSRTKRSNTRFRSLFNVASSGGSRSTITTGVRGLSEEKLHHPQPNPRALQEMHRLAVSKDEARRFARAGHLTASRMAYLPAPGK